MAVPRVALSFFALLALAAAQMPSCEDDAAAHCLGEDKDMSVEGIDSCLAALGAARRSGSCSAYLAVLEGCSADLAHGGVCAEAYSNGEAMPCLLQRVKPDQLSAPCAAALPKKAAGSGLADTFWADGKRALTDAEAATLKGEDVETYARWIKRKSGKKTDKDKDREYAVKQQKKQQATVAIAAKAEAAAAAALAAGADAGVAAAAAVDAAASKEIEEDMTGTLKSFSKAELKELAQAAVEKATRKVKAEL
jgi:hypothetical protein